MDTYSTRTEKTQSIKPRIDPVISDYPKTLTPQQAECYKNNGFIVIKGFFNKADVKEAFYASQEIFNNPSSNDRVVFEPEKEIVRSALGIHDRTPFAKFGENRLLINIIKDIVGSNPYIHQSRINYKEGMESLGWSWHSDFETWHAQDGMPRMRCVSAMVPLVKNTPANGALMIIPGSHKEYVSCPAPQSHSSADENFADQKEGIPNKEAIAYFTDKANGEIAVVECEQGDLVLFDCNVLHVSSPNVTAGQRTNLFFVYNSIDNQLSDPYCGIEPRPEWMGSRKNIKELI